MKKASVLYILFTLSTLCLSGCGTIGDKMTSMSLIYAAAAVTSLLLLVGFNYIIRNKDVWYQLLFSSIFIVNLGYFTLSISKTLEEALLANRIAYLGSVFLPMAMFLLILNVSKIRYKKWLPGILLAISTIVFLIAASPGYSTVYYQEVTLSFKNGAAVLNKVYGPLHCIYLYYLLGYFAAMVITTVYAVVKKKMGSAIQSAVLLSAVLINILVWLIEQLIHIDFEILSVSYIISELFLILLHFMVTEQETLITTQQETPLAPDISSSDELQPLIPEIAEPEQTIAEPVPEEQEPPSSPPEQELPSSPAETQISLEDQIAVYLEGLSNLTPTERIIYDMYISKNTTKEIMASLNIKENTLKFHNKNIYSKLGVSSRKQLVELSKHLNA